MDICARGLLQRLFLKVSRPILSLITKKIIFNTNTSMDIMVQCSHPYKQAYSLAQTSGGLAPRLFGDICTVSRLSLLVSKGNVFLHLRFNFVCAHIRLDDLRVHHGPPVRSPGGRRGHLHEWNAAPRFQLRVRPLRPLKGGALGRQVRGL